jgi:hypothetical protein
MMTTTTFALSNGIKRKFNVSSRLDVQVYKKFLETGSWGTGGCPFVLEPPYFSIPEMINDRLIRKFLSVGNNK